MISVRGISHATIHIIIYILIDIVVIYIMTAVKIIAGIVIFFVIGRGFAIWAAAVAVIIVFIALIIKIHNFLHFRSVILRIGISPNIHIYCIT